MARTAQGIANRVSFDARRYQIRKDKIDILKSVPCMDCGITYPPHVMDFDHVRGEKLFEIGLALSRNKAMPKILLEIEKCDVVCSNCHRIRTYNRRHADVME